MRRCLVAIVALGVAAAAPDAPAFVFCDDAAKLEELQKGLWTFNSAFLEKRFAELDLHFNAILAGMESGKVADAEVERWFRVFDNYGVDREPLHLDWIAKYPKSQAAYLAAAYHYVARGFRARGREFADKTSDTQMQAMADAFRKALFVLDKADASSRKPTLSTALRMRIVTASGMPKGTDATTLYRKALKSHPDTLQVRIRYVWASNPKWGGSIEQLSAINDEARGLGSADRRYIQYLVYEELGSAYETVDDAKRAAEAYERAIPLCPAFTDAIDSLIRVNLATKNLEGVISATTRFLERRPRAGPALTTRAWAYNEMKRHQESFNDYQKAVELGYWPAMEGLAWHYEWGKAVPRDYKRAIELYMTAADRGMTGAKEKAEKVSKGTGIPIR